MNLILFTSAHETRLPLSDPRAKHLIQVLRQRPGDSFDAGMRNGPRGRGQVLAIHDDAIELAFTWGNPPPPLDNLFLILGLSRPQTARRILRDAAALGVAGLHFVHTEKGEANYATSKLWSSGEWRRHLEDGTAQAFCTHCPKLTYGRSLEAAFAELPSDSQRFALDNYEAPTGLGSVPMDTARPTVLALGAERGWSTAEREQLRQARFTLAHLGPRVLRIETAVVAAIALAKQKRGLF